MFLKNFRTYQLAIEFHHMAGKVRTPLYLKDQLLRASSSIVLNLSEGSAKPTAPDRHKFYRVALGSQRECRSILDICNNVNPEVLKKCDSLGAHIYKLAKGTK